MGKIKNQSQAQKEIHNRAVKIRKMTDEELVKRFDTVIKLECAAGTSVEQLTPENMTRAACAARVSADQLSTKDIKEFLHALNAADLHGIGKVTLKKISEFAKEKGYI